MDRIHACRAGGGYQSAAVASEAAPQALPPVHAVERPPLRIHHEHPSPPLSWPFAAFLAFPLAFFFDTITLNYNKLPMVPLTAK
ncbi:hypothetical protein QTG54_011176 [Skeletonema marinoi]|uniref:Uncharacterized protein n=1 Tax=Skeletonema marinoi TaxID=267567 RepID=A0AAD8Y1W9_9STRA|nr:hypothetical protein QTG54_011176 [Skeletonema marinoi]